MEDLGKLYQVIFKKGLYTNSFEEFLNKYNDPSYQRRVYDEVTKTKDYTNSFENFKNKYPLYDQTDQEQSKIDKENLDLKGLKPLQKETILAGADIFNSPEYDTTLKAITAETEDDTFFNDIITKEDVYHHEDGRFLYTKENVTKQHTELIKQAKIALSKDGKEPNPKQINDWVKKRYIDDGMTAYVERKLEEELEGFYDKSVSWADWFKNITGNPAIGKWEEKIVDGKKKRDFIPATDYDRLTDSEKDYLNDRKEMAAVYEKRIEEIGEENAKRTYKLEQTERAITEIQNTLLELKAKSETTELTQDEIEQYRALYTQHEVNVSVFNKTLSEYSNAVDKVDKFSTLADMTRRTYANSDVIKNRMHSRWLQIKAGLLDVASELTPSQLFNRKYNIDIGEHLNEKKLTPQEIDELPILARVLLESDKIHDKIGEKRDEFYTESEKINKWTEKRQEFGEIKTAEDFGEFLLDLFSEQAVNTALTASLGGVGLGLVAASAGGNKFNEMRKDIARGENISAMQFYTAGLIYGAAEYITEKVALDQFIIGKKAFSRALDLDKTFGAYTAKKWNFLEAAGRYGVNVNREGSAELFASLGQNFADKYYLDKDIAMTQGLSEAYISGAIMSGLGFQAPVLVSDIYRAVTPQSIEEKNNIRSEKILANTTRINELLHHKQDKAGFPISSANTITQLQKENEQLLLENLQEKKASESRIDAIKKNPGNLQTLIDIDAKVHKLKVFADKTNADGNLSKEKRGDLVKRIGQQIDNLNVKKEVILASAQFAEGKKQRAKRQNDAIIENNLQDKIQNIEANNIDDALKKINKIVDQSDLSSEDKTKLKEQTANDFVANFDADGATVGAEFGLPITVQMQSNSLATEYDASGNPIYRGNSTVHSHEFGHGTLFRKLKDAGVDIVNMVDMLESHLKFHYKEAYNEFKEVQSNLIKDNIKTVVTGGQAQTAEQIAEEQLIRVSDFARQFNIKADKTLQSKLLTSFKKIFSSEYKKPGGLNTSVRTGEDVFNLLTSFNTYFETGEVSALLKAAFEGKLDVKKVDKKVKTKGGAVFSAKFKETRSNKEIANKNAEINQQIYDEDVRNEDGDLIVSDTLRDDLISNNIGKVYQLAQKAANNPNIANLEKGKLKTFEDFFQEYYTELDQLTRTYKPENTKGDFGAYMMQNLEKRYGGVLTRLKKGEVQGERANVDISEARGVVDPTESIETKLDEKRRKIEKVSKKVLSKEFGYDKIDKLVAQEMKKKGWVMPKSIKEVKDFNPRLTAALFNIKDINAYISPTRKIGKADIIRAKKVIKTLGPILHAVALLEGTNRVGKSTGTRNVLLNKFYKKDKSVLFKETGSKQGLPEQIKQSWDQKYWEQAFEIGKGRMMKTDQTLANLIEALIDATGKAFHRQAIKKELLKNPETRENALLIQGIEDGKSEIAFSKKLKDQSSQNKIKILDSLDNKSFYDKFDVAKKSNDNNWLKSLIINTIDPNTLKNKEKKSKKELAKELKRIKNDIIAIAEQLQHEVHYQREGAKKIGEGFNEVEFLQETFNNIRDEDVEHALINIAAGHGVTIRSKSDMYDTIDSINIFREKILNFFKERGYSKQFVNRYLAQGLKDPSGLGKFKKPTTKVGLKIKESQVDKKSGSWRPSLIANAQDLKDNFLSQLKDDPKDGDGKLPIFIYHKNWYTEKIPNTGLFKKEGIGGKKFHTLSNKDQKRVFEIIKNEGIKHQDKLKMVTEDLFEAYKNDQLTAEDVYVFVTSQYETMTGLIKTAAPLMAVPTMSKAEIVKKFKLDPKDPYVLEHLIPAIRIAGLTYNYILSAKNPTKTTKAKDLLTKELSVYGTSLIPKAYDKLINSNKNLKEIWNKKTGKFEGQKLYQELLPGIRKAGQHPLGPTGRTFGQYGKSVVPIQLTDPMTGKIWGPNPTVARNESQEAADNKEASMFSKKLDKKSKGISIIDFDDTLAITGSKVNYKIPRRFPDGRFNYNVVGWGAIPDTGSLTPAEFAQRHEELASMGAVFDYSEFNEVKNGKKGPFFDKAKELKKKFGNSDIYILTARPPSAKHVIQAFLKGVGLDIKLENIVGLENGTPQAKANWITQKITEGYNDILFADDQKQNIKAVKQVFNTFDVKGKVHQARTVFSKKLGNEFNKMLEETTGVEAYKTFSLAEARARGKNKFRWQPPGAEDFLGLLYPFFSKGKKGDMQMKMFREWLTVPYARGFSKLNNAKQELRDRFDNLVGKEHKGIKKILGKESGIGAFSNEHAVKVYLWNKYGQDYSETGLSKVAAKKLIDLVENNKTLKKFADDLGDITNLKTEYVTPTGDWMGRGIQQDVSDVANKMNRKIYFQEWIENKNAIFTEANLNKIQAIFGKNHRLALEDMLYRMEHGVTRNKGMDPTASWFMKWWSSATSTIMFFNRKSAALQSLSMFNFLNWKDNNPFSALRAFTNQGQFWSDFKMLWNSPMLKQRRKGLNIDVNFADMIDNMNKPGYQQTMWQRLGTSRDWLLNKGFLFTKLMDNFAIAFGGSSMYRNRVNTYLNKGLTQEQAEKKAFEDFQETSEPTQQSTRPDLISQEQASVYGRFLLAFQNVSMQNTRNMKKAISDIIKRRGDFKTNLSKILWYGGVQNAIFLTAQQGLMMLWSNADDEEKEKRTIKLANGMVDVILRGSGIVGGIVSVLKNVLIKYAEEAEKGYKAENAKIILEGLNISPPISSKFRKVFNAAQERKFSKKDDDWTVPYILEEVVKPTTLVAESLTNAPFHEAYETVDDALYILDQNNSILNRFYVGLGYPQWKVEKDEKTTTKKKKQTSKVNWTGTNNEKNKRKKSKINW